MTLLVETLKSTRHPQLVIEVLDDEFGSFAIRLINTRTQKALASNGWYKTLPPAFKDATQAIHRIDAVAAYKLPRRMK